MLLYMKLAFFDLPALLQALASFVSLSHSSLGISVFPVALSPICSAVIQAVCNYFLPTLKIHLKSPALGPDGRIGSLTIEFESSRTRPRHPGKVPSLSFFLLFEFIFKFPGLMLAPGGKISGSLSALFSALILHHAPLPPIFQLSIP